MPSTFSSNYSIELITTGEQAGRWGDTTNRNYQRFEQMAGGVATIKVDNYPTTGTAVSNWVADPGGAGGTFNWFTSDTAEAGENDSEGRCKYITFTSEGFINGDATVNIFGRDVSSHPTRVFIVRNDLVVDGSDKPSIILRCGGTPVTTVTVPNGKSAFVYSKSPDVKNVLDRLEFSSIDVGTLSADVLDLSGAASSGDAQIKVPNGMAEALKFVVGASDLMTFNTSGATDSVSFTANLETNAGMTVGGGFTVGPGDSSTQDLTVNGDLTIDGGFTGVTLIRDIAFVTSGDSFGGGGVENEPVCSHQFDFSGRSANSKVLIIGAIDLQSDPNSTNNLAGVHALSLANVRIFRSYDGGPDEPLPDAQQTNPGAAALLVSHGSMICSYPIIAYIADVPNETAEFKMLYDDVKETEMKWENGGMVLIDFGTV